jgi:hypothetical protein
MSKNRMVTFRVFSTTVLAFLLVCTVGAVSAFAAPKLTVRSITPDTVSAGEEVLLRLWVQNTGDTATQGPITMVDTFGSQVTSVKSEHFGVSGTGETSSVTPIGVECQAGTVSMPCEITGSLAPGVQVKILVAIKVPAGAAGSISDRISLSGGEAARTAEESSMQIGTRGGFGFDSGAVELSKANGSPEIRASATPAEFATKLKWKSFFSYTNFAAPSVNSDEFFKDVVAHLPPGLIGNPSASALCTTDELGSFLEQSETVGQEVPACPPDSQIGVARVGVAGWYYTTGLFNMIAPYGASAELGFNVFGTVVLLDAYVRPGDHGIDVITRDTSTSLSIPATEIVVWGVPADPSHDAYRGPCIGNAGDGPNGRSCPTQAHRQAFLRMPSSCTGQPLAFGAESNSYEHPSPMQKINFQGPTMAGCDMVPFAPEITVTPTTTSTSSPTGVNVKLSLPQTRNPEGLAEADLKKAVVTLPEGMAINPSSADGLEACDDAHLHLESNTPAECPDGSKIGTVLLHTQLIPNPIEGSVYIRTQNSNDPASGEMFRMVIELRDDAHGLDFKIPGHIQANPVTGRLTTTFDENPQFPFEDISLQFKSGARSPLSTPATCVTQTTEASLYPWARPDEATNRTSSFQLTSGPNETSCPGAILPFHPSLNAGVSDVEAGAFTSFLTTFSRSDADQHMQGVSVTMPKGLLGSLVGLPLCPEAQANAGTCSPDSQIGTTTAGAGTGPTPFYVTGGKVFMTGPYKGAPYGLSVVVPTKAGPFDLGTVVVRAKVEVDPHTAQLTVTTDPLPQVVSGVPVDLRVVNVTIDRPRFVFNPTNCAPATVTGAITGIQGSTVSVSNAFQVTNCAALKFPPRFTVATNGKTSRKNGASLDAKLTYPKTILGKVVNIAKVKVSLPKQLPSRLTTLQKACTAKTFEANPAACPAASRIGAATATTPVLPVALSGPVYFVSHGGEAFPDLVVVLQGYGVTVDLIGNTFISKAGITSTTFKQVPDVPVGTFELKLPQGKYSALAANGNLCTKKLNMPTAFTAQDGAEIHKSTAITVTGCAKHKATKTKESKKTNAHKKRR